MSDAVSAIYPRSMPKLSGVVPLILVGIVLLMVAPLPAVLLDVLLASSIAISVALLLVALHLEKPLDLSSFPTILLFTTLLRLSLNVASTRLILMEGSGGSDAAGAIIQAFGNFVVGGNYLVGAAVFILLVIINFVVITKGSGRVAEVSARFTLDSLPGKQMSIDADLNAGAITQAQAQERRREIEKESDFFGSMDGASKFVRGDAIAGLLMTGINIAVGFLVGTLQEGLSAADAASTYTILTVGDGLASQIPSLLVSTAAGVVVTRAASGASIGSTLVQQIGKQKTSLTATAGILAGVGLLPGMPVVPFFLLAGGTALAARAAGAAISSSTESKPEAEDKTTEPSERDHLEKLLQVELLELEVGFELVSMVDASRGGELVDRVSAIRRNLAAELGIVIPSIHIRDNLRLGPSEYRLLLSGNEVGRGEVRARKFLAMDPTGTLAPIAGEEVQEPAFGLPARWIPESAKENAEIQGFTVVDATTVATTHLTEMLRSVAPELLGRQETQELLDLFAQREPRILDELIPNLLSLGEVIQILKQLLRESISIRDLRTILEALADHARESKDTFFLTEKVRARLARYITARFKDENNTIAALALDPQTEEVFRQGGPDAPTAGRLLSSLNRDSHLFAQASAPPVILCSPTVRRTVAEFFARRIPGLAVLSYAEIDAQTSVRTLAILSS